MEENYPSSGYTDEPNKLAKVRKYTLKTKNIPEIEAEH